MSKNDISLIRKQFPIFKRTINNYPLIFLDSASTAQMPQSVLDKIIEYYTTYKSNIGRGIYTFAEEATAQVQNARKKIASFINAQQEEIVFTSGATAGINYVVNIWAEHYINPGDEIIVSEIEHHSNFVPWQQLALRKGAILKIIPVNKDGIIDIELFKIYISKKTKFVAIFHQSNILGTTNDVAGIVKAAQQVGAKVLIDAAQSIVHQHIDVKTINCDFLIFSGHKLYGPTGVGVLFIKQSMFKECTVGVFGGGMVYSVTSGHTKLKPAPDCFEAGTLPIAQIIGLSAAIDFIYQSIDYHFVQRHETSLVQQLAKELLTIPGITLLSPVPQTYTYSNIVTFVSTKHHAHDIAAYVDNYGIAVRAGHHCVQSYHQKLGVNASVRVSFAAYNTHEEVMFLAETLKKLLL